jgi:hypothetical protein
MHMVIHHIDKYQSAEAQTSFSLIDPREVVRLREEWISDAASRFPTILRDRRTWESDIRARVATADTFRLALLAHLDQVRLANRVPYWIDITRGVAIGMLVAFLAVGALIIIEPFGDTSGRNGIIALEVFAGIALLCGLISAVAHDRFRAKRSKVISEAVRSELKLAISHCFAKPISQLSAEHHALIAAESHKQLTIHKTN